MLQLDLVLGSFPHHYCIIIIMPQVHRYKSYHALYKVSLNTAITSFLFGFGNIYFNSLNFDDIIAIYSLQAYSRSTLQGCLTGILSICGGLGAYSSQFLLRHFSRKCCLQILASLAILVSLLIQIPNLYVLIICRVLCGLTCGMCSVVASLYLRQFSPTEIAASLCPYHQILIVFGILSGFTLSYLCSLIWPAHIYWRIVFGFPLIPASFQLYNLHYKYPYQTPKYLLLMRREAEAKELLAVIYKEEYIEEVFQEIQTAIALNTARPVKKPSEEVQLKQMNNKNQNQNQNQNQKRTPLLNKEVELHNNRLTVLISYHLSVHQQMVGMGPILAYSGQIVGLMLPAAEKVFPIFINIVAISGCFLAIPLVKWLGRKKNLEYGALATAICLALLSFALMRFDFDAIGENSVSLTFYVMFLFILIRTIFSLTTGPIIWLYVSEIVQSNAYSNSVMVNWMSVGCINFFFPIVKEMVGGNPGPVFMIFSVYTFLAYLANHFLLIETADKPEHKIREQFDAKWK